MYFFGRGAVRLDISYVLTSFVVAFGFMAYKPVKKLQTAVCPFPDAKRRGVAPCNKNI